MRHTSIKVRMTVWYTALMALMAVLVLLFMLFISNSVIAQTAQSQLSRSVRDSLPHIHMSGGSLQLDEGFSFYDNGVYLLLYSESEALLAGQIPTPFTGVEEPFQSGLTRPVSTTQGRYYVLDFWLQLSWEEGLWVRGLLAAPEDQQTAVTLLRVAAVAMPAFILLAALGGWWIAKRAVRPLDRIIDTAAAISQGRDLSARLSITEGSSEFVRLSETFDGMLERLERSFEAEKQFTNDASHELRTPVSVILSACEYAEKYDETPEERRETLETIHRQGKKMAELISQLLQMTRMDQGTEQVRLEPTDLTELVRTLCDEQGERRKQLIQDLQEHVTARADGTLLTRLVQNLLDNAWKYGKPGGNVWVTLRAQAGEIRLTVRDEGPGIPKEQQDRIWQRFYQVDPARGRDRGAGLGLSIVRQIARLHGGTVTLESAPGAGSAFTLHLPAAEGLPEPGKKF